MLLETSSHFMGEKYRSPETQLLLGLGNFFGG
jgi:hypothetical protein